MNSPSSDWAQLRLILGLALRGYVNKFFANMAAANMSRKERLAAREGAVVKSRKPTPRKKVSSGLILAYLFISIPVFAILITGNFLGSLSLDHTLQQATINRLAALEKASGKKLDGARPDAAAAIAADSFVLALPSEQQTAVTAELSRRWVEDGTWAFTHSYTWALPDTSAAYPIQYERLVTFSTLACFLAFIAVIGAHIGLSQNVARVESGILWLISQPVPARVLFAAKIVEYATLNLIFWLCALPFFTLCALAAGHGWASLLIALGACIPISIALAGIRLGIETACRLNLKPAWRKDIQIICTMISTFLMFALYMAMMSGMGAALWGHKLLPWAELPMAWPLRAVLTPGINVLPWMAANGILALAVAAAGIGYSVRSVRGGFISDTDTLQGERQPRAIRSKSWLPLTLVGKDLRMLYRDRLFLFNVLGLPFFMIGMQFVLNPELIGAVAGNFRHACTLAYVLGGYLLIPSATTVLSAEGAALWLITSAPQPLLRLLQQKLLLWTGLAMAYTLIALAAALMFTPWPGSAGFADVIMVLLGVPIFAVIAVGIGAAATDVLATDPKQRIDQGAMMALMLIVGMHGQAIYTAEGHGRLLWLMLSGVLAYAMWQRLEIRLAWLLDPTDRPARRIDLADGALAAMAFMFTQSLIGLMLSWFDVQPALTLLIAFTCAGIFSALGALYMFWRNGLADILQSTGLMPDKPWRLALRVNLVWGIAGGLLAGLIGAAYLHLLAQFPLLAGDAPAIAPLPLWTIVAITVLAAPLAEEFIFRGLLFKGLCASLPVRWAVPASAAAFALIHPTMAVLPVFALGCIAAIAYRRTGWLLAPMLAHGIYNAVVVMLSR